MSSSVTSGGGGGGGGRLGGALLDLLEEEGENEASRRRATLGCNIGDLTAAAVIAALGREGDCVTLPLSFAAPVGDPGAGRETCRGGTGGTKEAPASVLKPPTVLGGCILKTDAPLGGPPDGVVVDGGLPPPRTALPGLRLM